MIGWWLVSLAVIWFAGWMGGWSVGVRSGMRAGLPVRQLPPTTTCPSCGEVFGPWGEPEHFLDSGLVLQVRQCGGCGYGEEREVEIR